MVEEARRAPRLHELWRRLEPGLQRDILSRYVGWVPCSDVRQALELMQLGLGPGWMLSVKPLHLQKMPQLLLERGLIGLHVELDHLDARRVPELAVAFRTASGAPGLRHLRVPLTFAVEPLAAREELASALVALRMPQLRALDMAGHELGPALPRVVEALAERCPRLRDLNLARNLPGHAGVAAVAALLAKGGLEALCLRGEVLGTGPDQSVTAVGAEAIAEVLPRGGAALGALDLSYNQLGDQGALAVARNLEHAPVLRALDLSVNRIGDEAGAQVIAVALACKHLERLALRRCTLGPRAFKAAAAALRGGGGQRVRELNLGSNRPGPEAAVALISAVAGLACLENLQIFHCGLEAAAARALAAAIASGCSRLRAVNLGSNPLCEDRGALEGILDALDLRRLRPHQPRVKLFLRHDSRAAREVADTLRRELGADPARPFCLAT